MNVGIVQDFLRAEPLGGLIGFTLRHALPLNGIFFTDTRDIVEIGEVQQGGKFAFGMSMLRADLCDLDTGGGMFLPLRPTGEQRGSGGVHEVTARRRGHGRGG